MKKIGFSIAGKSLRFSLAGLAGYLILLAALCFLGLWQLNRAEQKRDYLRQLAQANDGEAVDLNALEQAELAALEYRRVKVAGRYDDDHQFLIDNQVKQGKAGYFIMTPFIVDGRDAAVLVNRGWVALAQEREAIPDIHIEQREATIEGRINHFPPVALKLEGADVPSEGWPATVQVVDHRILADRLGYALFDFQIELAPSINDGYLRDWETVSVMPPEKHIAYAVQWFALALTLTVLVVWFGIKEHE